MKCTPNWFVILYNNFFPNRKAKLRHGSDLECPMEEQRWDGVWQHIFKFKFSFQHHIVLRLLSHMHFFVVNFKNNKNMIFMIYTFFSSSKQFSPPNIAIQVLQLFTGVTFLDTKTDNLGLNQAKTMLFPLLLEVFPYFQIIK